MRQLWKRFDEFGYKALQFVIITAYVRMENLRTKFENEVRRIAQNGGISVVSEENEAQPIFGMDNNHAYIFDECGRLTFIIVPPWSHVQFPYIKAAIFSTLFDVPCGDCEVPFLSSPYPGYGGDFDNIFYQQIEQNLAQQAAETNVSEYVSPPEEKDGDGNLSSAGSSSEESFTTSFEYLENRSSTTDETYVTTDTFATTGIDISSDIEAPTVTSITPESYVTSESNTPVPNTQEEEFSVTSDEPDGRFQFDSTLQSDSTEVTDVTESSKDDSFALTTQTNSVNSYTTTNGDTEVQTTSPFVAVEAEPEPEYIQFGESQEFTPDGPLYPPGSFIQDDQIDNFNDPEQFAQFQSQLDWGDQEEDLNDSENDTYNLPLRIIIPSEHVHRNALTDFYTKYNYIVLKAGEDNDANHDHLSSDTTDELRKLEPDDPELIKAQRLVDTSNSTDLYVNQMGQIYALLKEYHENHVGDLNEVSLLETDVYRDEPKNLSLKEIIDLKRHYNLLIQWLNWQFED